MRFPFRVTMLAALAVVSQAALADGDGGGFEAGVKLKGAWYEEGPRDLGFAPAPGETAAPEKRSSGFVDAQPYMYAPYGESFAFYTRVQLFASTGDEVIQNENDLPVANDSFAALREFWIEFDGPSDYPGDKLRLGLQRTREPTGLWYDRDIESLRWRLDTTLVQADFGAGEQFDVYRTDDVELSPTLRDRLFGWGSLERQWRPGYVVGVRAVYAYDHGELPENGTTLDERSKRDERQALWLGLHTGTLYYDPRSTNVVGYWFEAIGEIGEHDYVVTSLDPATPDLVDHRESGKLRAMAGDAGLRLRIPSTVPVIFGVQGAYAQGDPGRSGVSNRFEPTGLESNRSRFTGTRALVHRFNEAFQGNFSNLLDAAAYFSLSGETLDFSAVYHQMQREDTRANYVADGIDVTPVNDSADLGSGFDVVLSKYFGGARIAGVTDSDDNRSNVRLRASQFMPGEAYGPDAKNQTRVMAEVTLWF